MRYGLPTPRPHHALLATPLASLPDPSGSALLGKERA